MSRRLAVARLLSPERECRPAAEKQALLNAGLAEITDARLEELAWRRCPSGSEAALFHGPFVHVKQGGESSFAMVLSCFGVEEPVPGFAAAAARESAGMMGSEAERLIDGWDFAGMENYWEVSNVVLFSRSGGSFEYLDVLAHFSRERARLGYTQPIGYPSELQAAFSCALEAQWGEAP